MSLVTDAQARAHIRIDAGEDITIYIGAACQSAINYCNRKIYDDQNALDAAVTAGIAGDDPIVVDFAIQAAVLMTLGHLYENRQTVVLANTAKSAVALPISAEYLLQPYRVNIGA